MRAIAALIAIVAAFSTDAFAQSPAKFVGIAPYMFGMTIDDARGAAAKEAFKVEPWSDHITQVFVREPLMMADILFETQLGFLDQQLTTIRLSTTVAARKPEICAGQYQRLLTEVSALTGPFEAEALPRTIPFESAAAARAARPPVPPKKQQKADLASSIATPDASAIWYYDLYDAGRSQYLGDKQGEDFSVRLWGDWARGKCFLDAFFHNTSLSSALVRAIEERARLAQEATGPQPPPPLSAKEIERIRAAEEISFRELRMTAMPSAADSFAVYPVRAQRLEQHGAVVLTCLLEADGAFRCVVDSEDPPEFGFARAALALSTILRADPVPEQVGKRFRLRLPFILGGE